MRTLVWRDRHPFRVLTALAAALALVGLAGCDGKHADPAAIRVADTSIGERAVAHWTATVTRGALVANLTGSTQPAARQQALDFLIGSAWLEAEARRLGLKPSRGEIARSVEEQRSSSPDGAAGFKAMLAESGQTLADVEAEAKARWAAGALARRLEEAVDAYGGARVTDRVVAGYYRAHPRSYHQPERRYYDLYESIRTKAEAMALERRLLSGKPAGQKPNHEKPFRPPSFRNLPGQATVYRAVFAARKTNVIVGPLPLQGRWCLFILRRIVPARLQPLSEVRGPIERKLRAPLQRRERARLIAAYRRRWLEQTDCRPGYVVQKCRQFKGRHTPEPEPFASF